MSVSHTAMMLARQLLCDTKMRPFTKEDWMAFAGCESEDPQIGVNGDFTLVMDGSTLLIVHKDDEGGGEIYPDAVLA